MYLWIFTAHLYLICLPLPGGLSSQPGGSAVLSFLLDQRGSLHSSAGNEETGKCHIKRAQSTFLFLCLWIRLLWMCTRGETVVPYDCDLSETWMVHGGSLMMRFFFFCGSSKVPPMWKWRGSGVEKWLLNSQKTGCSWERINSLYFWQAGRRKQLDDTSSAWRLCEVLCYVSEHGNQINTFAHGTRCLRVWINVINSCRSWK